MPAWVALVVVEVVTWALVIYETTAWSATRHVVRDEHGLPGEDGHGDGGAGGGAGEEST